VKRKMRTADTGKGEKSGIKLNVKRLGGELKRKKTTQRTPNKNVAVGAADALLSGEKLKGGKEDIDLKQ